MALGKVLVVNVHTVYDYKKSVSCKAFCDDNSVATFLQLRASFLCCPLSFFSFFRR